MFSKKQIIIRAPYVEKRMREFYRGNWQQNLSLASGGDPKKPLDAYALLKTMLDNWQTVFRDGLKPMVRNHVSPALAARNDPAHAGDTIADADATGTAVSTPKSSWTRTGRRRRSARSRSRS